MGEGTVTNMQQAHRRYHVISTTYPRRFRVTTVLALRSKLKAGRLQCRWRLFDEIELSGKANAKIKKAIRELRKEGAFEALERLIDED